MPSENLHYEHAPHALFSICATPDVVSAALTASSEISGSEFVGEFHDYFTPDRRPQLSATIKASNMCVAVVDCDRDPEMAISTMEAAYDAAAESEHRRILDADGSKLSFACDACRL